MMSLMVTQIKAQPLAGLAQPLAELLKETMDSVQDTSPVAQEAQVIELLNTSIQSLSDKGRRDRRIGGYVLLGLGVGSGIGGAATFAFIDGDNARIVGYSGIFTCLSPPIQAPHSSGTKKAFTSSGNLQ